MKKAEMSHLTHWKDSFKTLLVENQELMLLPFALMIVFIFAASTTLEKKKSKMEKADDAKKEGDQETVSKSGAESD